MNGESGVLAAHEPFYRTGGDFSFNYRTFNLFGLYMYGHDKDLELNSWGTGFIRAVQRISAAAFWRPTILPCHG